MADEATALRAELAAARRRIARLEALDRVSRSVRSPADLDDALREVAATAAATLGDTLCALALDTAVPGRPRVVARSSPAGAADATLAALAARAPLHEPGAAAVPLEAQHRRLGGLVCLRAESAPFSAAELELLGEIAERAALAVAAARGALRGMLTQEVHHRVKNNLQTVASLLRLAAAGDDPRRALTDSIGRVLAIAEVHDLLTESRDEDVASADLVRRLSEMLRQSLGGTVDTSALAPITLAPERATALALVYCELHANAVEHGGGEVSVTLRRDGAFGELAVGDRGPGPLPDPAATGGLGLGLARALATAELGGSLDFAPGTPGVIARVRFPL